MVSPITEIATELASQNPGITSEQITEIIVDSIESEPIISGAIARIQIPTRSQTKQAEFMSSNFRKKTRAKILERIENANFFRNLQLRYINPIQGSYLRQSIHRDGARVDLSSPIEYSDSSYQRFYKTSNIDKTDERIQYMEDTPMEYSHNVITRELSAQNTQENKESSSSILQEIIDEYEASTDFLSLYNIYQIIRILQTSQDQVNVLNNIYNTISSDVKKRNRTYRTNCIDELYRGDEALPEELRLSKSSSSSISDRISESLKAIILHEYKSLHNHCGKQFIDNQINYDNYIQTTNRYSLYADRLFSELPS